jgi:hypothetical protein
MKAKHLHFGDYGVTKIVIVRDVGTDKISFSFDGAPSPFPEMDLQEPGKYEPHYTIEVRRGYAEEWLKKTYGILASFDEDVQLIDTHI